MWTLLIPYVVEEPKRRGMRGAEPRREESGEEGSTLQRILFRRQFYCQSP